MGALRDRVRADFFPWVDTAGGELVDEVAAVSAIPAPPFGEQARGHYLLERLGEVGLSGIERDGAGNVWGVRPGRGHGPRLLLAAHMDTVFPPGTHVAPRWEHGWLCGPGVRDNSAGVAALIGLQRGLEAVGITLPGDLVLAATVGEEGLGNLRGIRAVCDAWQDRVDAVLVVDGDLGSVCHAGIASLRLGVRLCCPGGHSWGDFGRPNAIHLLGGAVAQLAALRLPVRPRTTLSVGRIAGGVAINAIPPEAEMDVDLRSASPDALSDLEARVRGILRRAASGPSAGLEVGELGRRPAGSLSADHPLVELARRTCRDFGLSGVSEPGSTDANEPLARGIPAVCTGVSRGDGVHTLGERLELDSLPVGLKLLGSLVAACMDELRREESGGRRRSSD